MPWDAVDTWLEEGRKLVHYPPNPYHRVDCRPTNRGLRVVVAETTLVDTSDTMVVFETALAPLLYVDPSHAHRPVAALEHDQRQNWAKATPRTRSRPADPSSRTSHGAMMSPCPKPSPSRGFQLRCRAGRRRRGVTGGVTPLTPTAATTPLRLRHRRLRLRTFSPGQGHFSQFASGKGRALGHYIANVRDIEFNLFEVLNLSQVLDSGGYRDLDSDTVRTMLDEVARLAEGPVAESFAAADRNPVFDPSSTPSPCPPRVGQVGAGRQGRRMVAHGLAEEVGGVAAPAALTWAINEMLAAPNPSAGFWWAWVRRWHTRFAAEGNEQQIRWAAKGLERDGRWQRWC